MMIKVKFSMTKTFHGPLSRKWIDGRYWYPTLICHALFYVEEESVFFVFFFFLSELSFTDTDNSQDSRGRNVDEESGYHSYKKNENKSSPIPYYHRR